MDISEQYQNNAVYYVLMDNDEYYGFVITNGANLAEEFKQENMEGSPDSERRSRVDAMRTELEIRGYKVGPALSQSHYAWLIDGFGYAGTLEDYQELQEQALLDEMEIDQQEDDHDEQLG